MGALNGNPVQHARRNTAYSDPGSLSTPDRAVSIPTAAGVQVNVAPAATIGAEAEPV